MRTTFLDFWFIQVLWQTKLDCPGTTRWRLDRPQWTLERDFWTFCLFKYYDRWNSTALELLNENLNGPSVLSCFQNLLANAWTLERDFWTFCLFKYDDKWNSTALEPLDEDLTGPSVLFCWRVNTRMRFLDILFTQVPWQRKNGRQSLCWQSLMYIVWFIRVSNKRLWNSFLKIEADWVVNSFVP